MNREDEVENIRLQLYELVKSRTTDSDRFATSIVVKAATEKPYKTKEQIPETFTITKSYWDVYSMGIVFTVYILLVGFISKSLFPALFFACFAVVAALLYTINSFYLVDRITLSKKGVDISGKQISWQDIYQIYTARYAQGKSVKNILFIILVDKTLKEFDVSNSAYTDLGHLIEKYKRLYLKDVTPPAPIHSDLG